MQTDKINVLVAVADYPDGHGKLSSMFVHTRNKHYKEHGIDVTVLNFRAGGNYVVDDIPVITLNHYEREPKKYDVLICHAANLRNHYRFLVKHGKNFPKFVFVYHGHEVLKTALVYPPPYPYVGQSKVKSAVQSVYDPFKLSVWRRYLPRVMPKSTLVFVSRWMLDEFLTHTKITPDALGGSYAVIYNSIDRLFEETEYDWDAPKEYDFITVRGNLDGSKYSADIVNELAKNNPEMKFLVVGKGRFFEHYEKAPNLEWKNQTMRHEEIIQHLQKARCALMPTRTDAQGLMMCEMASTGMPLITSDLPVCREVFDGFDNVALIDNKNTLTDLNEICRELEQKGPFQKNDRYSSANTVSREVDLIKRLSQADARDEMQ